MERRRTSEFWSYPQSWTFAELLIDCEEDRTLRRVLVGMLREGRPPSCLMRVRGPLGGKVPGRFGRRRTG
jgi:hypothetical protein